MVTLRDEFPINIRVSAIQKSAVSWKVLLSEISLYHLPEENLCKH